MIVGAGAAGLMAARTLTAAGLGVVILEARHRIGGRIFTIHESLAGVGDVPIELGAEFVHGLPPVSWDLIREGRLETYELDGPQVCFENSRLQPCDEQQGSIFHVLKRMSSWLESQPPLTDMSFAEYLRRNPVESSVAARAAAYVEGFNAADRHIIGIAGLARQQLAEDGIEGDRLFHVARGYECLPQMLCREFAAREGRLLLSHPVSAIRWQKRQVVANGFIRDGEPFEMSADRLICTLPLAVLQSGSVDFQPAIPQMTEPASQLKMGDAKRVSLLFLSRFWAESRQLQANAPVADQLQRLSFVFARDTAWPTWWTAAPRNLPLITAWVGGPRAGELPADRLKQLAISDAGRIFSLTKSQLDSQLVGAHCHDWHGDPYARGAYTYVPAGALAAPELLSRPVADTLFFAGEHTDMEGHWGTVHAALNSGRRAAAQILASR